MRLIHLPTVWTILLDCLAWAILQPAVAAVSLQLPLKWLNPESPFFAPAKWEDEGEFYQRWLNIRVWKSKIPSLADIFFGKRGFPLDQLVSRDKEYLYRWLRESCRSELCHWVAILPAALFFLWNKLWVAWIMVLYAVIFNLPLIIIARYNRPKVKRLLKQ